MRDFDSYLIDHRFLDYFHSNGAFREDDEMVFFLCNEWSAIGTSII